MPSLPIHLPSPHAAAGLLIRAINETQSISNTTIPKNCTAPKDSPEYTSGQCGKSISKLLAPYMNYIDFGIFLVAFGLCVIFASCLLKWLDRRDRDRPLTYPIFLVAPPRYTESVDTLPPYSSVEESVELTRPPPTYTPGAAILRGYDDTGETMEALNVQGQTTTKSSSTT
ncbi:hypothetical protein OCU04_007370 [Sclerotinia nivalis]|uniref:Uncharacterized protein n=1 Tax=Sclerotinia nivalis TaxID=352851 RepID=A0A9X0AIP5_9HELO|nr:hypothetical protein OCU04_007370 [Sclerotinia nivalis]